MTELPSSAAVMSALVSWKASFVYGYLAWALFVHEVGPSFLSSWDATT